LDVKRSERIRVGSVGPSSVFYSHLERCFDLCDLLRVCHKMTGIRRLYQEMSRDEEHDLSFELERKHTMGLLLSAKNQRKNLEQEAERRTTSKDETSKETNTSAKKKKPIPKQSPKMASAMNAYMGASASKKNV